MPKPSWKFYSRQKCASKQLINKVKLSKVSGSDYPLARRLVRFSAAVSLFHLGSKAQRSVSHYLMKIYLYTFVCTLFHRALRNARYARRTAQLIYGHCIETRTIIILFRYINSHDTIIT